MRIRHYFLLLALSLIAHPVYSAANIFNTPIEIVAIEGALFEIAGISQSDNPSFSWILTREGTFLQAGRNPIFRSRLQEAGTYELIAEMIDAEDEVHVQRLFKITVDTYDEEAGTVDTFRTQQLLSTVPQTDAAGRIPISDKVPVIELLPNRNSVKEYKIDTNGALDTDEDGNSFNDDNTSGTYFSDASAPLYMWFTEPKQSQMLTVHIQTDSGNTILPVSVLPDDMYQAIASQPDISDSTMQEQTGSTTVDSTMQTGPLLMQPPPKLNDQPDADSDSTVSFSNDSAASGSNVTDEAPGFWVVESGSVQVSSAGPSASSNDLVINVQQDGAKNVFSASGPDIANNNLLFYTWDFGDGTQSIEENPTHSYMDPGNYAVSLRVQNLATGQIVATSSKEISITKTIDDLPSTGGDSQNPDDEDNSDVVPPVDTTDGSDTDTNNPDSNTDGDSGDGFSFPFLSILIIGIILFVVAGIIFMIIRFMRRGLLEKTVDYAEKKLVANQPESNQSAALEPEVITAPGAEQSEDAVSFATGNATQSVVEDDSAQKAKEESEQQLNELQTDVNNAPDWLKEGAEKADEVGQTIDSPPPEPLQNGDVQSGTVESPPAASFVGTDVQETPQNADNAPEWGSKETQDSEASTTESNTPDWLNSSNDNNDSSGGDIADQKDEATDEDTTEVQDETEETASPPWLQQESTPDTASVNSDEGTADTTNPPWMNQPEQNAVAQNQETTPPTVGEGILDPTMADNNPVPGGDPAYMQQTAEAPAPTDPPPLPQQQASTPDWLGQDTTQPAQTVQTQNQMTNNQATPAEQPLGTESSHQPDASLQATPGASGGQSWDDTAGTVTGSTSSGATGDNAGQPTPPPPPPPQQDESNTTVPQPDWLTPQNQDLQGSKPEAVAPMQQQESAPVQQSNVQNELPVTETPVQKADTPDWLQTDQSSGATPMASEQDATPPVAPSQQTPATPVTQAPADPSVPPPAPTNPPDSQQPPKPQSDMTGIEPTSQEQTNVEQPMQEMQQVPSGDIPTGETIKPQAPTGDINEPVAFVQAEDLPIEKQDNQQSKDSNLEENTGNQPS